MCKIWTLEDPENLNTKCITIIKTKAHGPGCLATYTLGQSGTLRYAKIITRTPSQLQAQSNTILSSTPLSVFTTLCAVVTHLFGARSLSKTCQSVHWQVLQALSPLYRNLLCPIYRFIICGLLWWHCLPDYILEAFIVEVQAAWCFLIAAQRSSTFHGIAARVLIKDELKVRFQMKS